MAAGFDTKCKIFGVCSCETHHLKMTPKNHDNLFHVYITPKTYEACAAAGATSWRAIALGESDKVASRGSLQMTTR